VVAQEERSNGKDSNSYWSRRPGLMYYSYVEALVGELASHAESMIDIGSADTPLLEKFDWIPRRCALDKRNPYSSNNVTGVKADFLKFTPEKRFDFALCLQVLEHIPEAESFARKLFEIADHVVISVPYRWEPDSSDHHVHDPVDLGKLYKWTGREPSYYIIVPELFNSKSRLICYYHPEGKKIMRLGTYGKENAQEHETSTTKNCVFLDNKVGTKTSGYSFTVRRWKLKFINYIKRLKNRAGNVLNSNAVSMISWRGRENNYAELARRAMKSRSFMEAVDYWKEAQKRNRKNSAHQAHICYNLARCYMKLKEPELVSHNMKKYLELEHNFDLEEVITKIKNEIDANPGNVTSSYRYIGGRGNLGFIEHTRRVSGREEKYLTKISRNNSGVSEKEKKFYRDICETFPGLKSITPGLVDLFVLPEKNLCFLTMERVTGKHPREKNHLQDIVEVQKVLASIKYHMVIDFIDRDDLALGFELENFNYPGGKRVRNTFANIHKASTNRKVIKWLYRRAEALNCSEETVDLIKKLEHYILDLKLYEKLDPADYSLQHGDFGRHNILVEEESGRLYLYDWSSYIVAPAGFDMAFYFRKRRYPFSKIKKWFLSTENSSYLKDIEKIFFLYALVVLRFVDDVTDREMEGSYYEYLHPALKQMKKLASR